MEKEINIWLNHNPYTDKKKAKPYSDGILQQLLQQALNTSKTIDIKKTINGKPYVDEPVYFSHSNCRQVYAYVISKSQEVSVDLEYIDYKRQVLKLAHRYFNKKEFAALLTLSATCQSEYFFDLWTQKEAWCKLEAGNLWSYLNKNMDGLPISFYKLKQIKGFAGTLASPNIITKVRINSIGEQ